MATPTPTFNLSAAMDAASQPPLVGGTSTASGGAAAAGGNIYYQPLDYGYTNQFILAGDQRRAPTQMAPVQMAPIIPANTLPIAGPQGTPMNFGDPAAPMGGPMQGTARVDAPVGRSLNIGGRQYPLNQLVAQLPPAGDTYADGTFVPQGFAPPQQARMAPVPYPMSGAYPQVPQSAPPFVRNMPQMVPQDPAAIWAQQQQMRLARQAMRNSAAPLPMAPQPIGSQGGFVGRMQRLAGSLNPQIGRRNQAAYTGQVQMYNNAVDAQRQWGAVAQGALGNIATNQRTIDEAQYKQNWDIAMKFLQTGSPSDYNSAVHHMLDMIPDPGPERDSYIQGMLEMTNGQLDLRPARNVKNPKGIQMMENRELEQENKRIKNEVAAATKEADKQRKIASAARAEIQAQIIKASQSSIVTLNQIRAEKARIEADIRKQYGAQLAQGALNALNSAYVERERHAFEGALSAQKNIFDEYTKLQGQMSSLIASGQAAVPTIPGLDGKPVPNPAYEQVQHIKQQMAAFGAPDQTTGLPQAVHNAAKFMAGQSTPREKVLLPGTYEAITGKKALQRNLPRQGPNPAAQRQAEKDAMIKAAEREEATSGMWAGSKANVLATPRY